MIPFICRSIREGSS